MYLNKQDLHFCVKRLPKKLKELMKKEERTIIIAGGYIRSIITGEKISDIDIFVGDKKTSKDLAWKLAVNKWDLYETANAITVKNLYIPIQFVHRWVYDNPLDVVKSFDFSICQAAMWYDKEEKKWASSCEDSFYQDLASKRLVYLSPERNEDAGGSLLRVLKYYQRGYRIPLDSFGAVLARLLKAVKNPGELDEKEMAKIITGLLFEVDPAGFIDYNAYLPKEKEKEE